MSYEKSRQAMIYGFQVKLIAIGRFEYLVKIYAELQ